MQEATKSLTHPVTGQPYWWNFSHQSPSPFPGGGAGASVSDGKPSGSIFYFPDTVFAVLGEHIRNRVSGHLIENLRGERNFSLFWSILDQRGKESSPVGPPLGNMSRDAIEPVYLKGASGSPPPTAPKIPATNCATLQAVRLLVTTFREENALGTT